jgi:two-component system, OmpR family, response regulator
MQTAEQLHTDAVLAIGTLEIEPKAYRATLKGATLVLSPSQLELLGVLVANRDRVVSRAELAKAAGLEQAGSVDVLLSSLRRVLGEGFVRNVRNRGWILEPSAFDR